MVVRLCCGRCSGHGQQEQGLVGSDRPGLVEVGVFYTRNHTDPTVCGMCVRVFVWCAEEVSASLCMCAYVSTIYSCYLFADNSDTVPVKSNVHNALFAYRVVNIV